VLRRIVLGAAVAVYLLSAGFTAGVVAERVRFDRARSHVLRRYEDAAARTRAWLMSIERGQIQPGRAALTP
jgi:hypothetical protein